MQKIGRWALERFLSQKFHFEIFPKTDAISNITFGPRYIHGQSLKEIFPTQNAVDLLKRDSLLRLS